MRIELRHIAFVAFGTRFHLGLYIRFLRWHMALKPTKNELFSERYGYAKTYRLGGLSLTLRRVRTIA